MINVEVQTNIAKPPEQVYDFVVTNYVQNHPRWDPRVVRSQLTSGEAVAVGAAGVEVRKQMGREMTYNFRITELTSDHVSFDAKGSGTDFGSTWAVTPSVNGSRLEITFHLGLAGPMKLFEPFMKGGVRKEMDQAAQKIKELVEAS